MTRSRERLVLALTLCTCAPIFLLGITWGLPSRTVDPFLFGDRPVWTGKQILQLAGDRSAQSKLGADVDRNPLARNTNIPIILNDTDQQRAEIIRRYRLYTYQPDEMITMMALASMRPSERDFDPKLYQYGGLWIYPVGALIKVFAKPQADAAYYLDHPEEFGRFYVIARLYVVAWAMIGAWAVFWIVRRLTNQPLLAACATLCYALMPVVVNMAHEAKPHLPAAVLILLAVIAATKFVETGLKRYWALAGVLVGASAGMVLSAIPAIVILPIMCWLRRDSWNQRLIILITSVIIAIDVYFITNPYVLIHLLGDRTILLSNLRNSQAMYTAPVSLKGLANADYLFWVASTLPLWLAVLFGFFALRWRWRIYNPMLKMLLAVASLVVIQFGLLATDKPAEYARFALFPAIVFWIVLFRMFERMKTRPPWAKLVAPIGLTVVVGSFGSLYVWHFVDDSRVRTPRIIAAERLRKLAPKTVGVTAEPAPYCLPPVNLFTTRLVLHASTADVTIHTVDDTERRTEGEYWSRPRVFDTPISWAHKPFEVRVAKPTTVPSAP